MLFNSLEFLAFFPVVTTLFFLFPSRLKWLLLLIASCYFYMAWVPVYILVLFFIIIVDFVAAKQIEKSIGIRRKAFLLSSLAANLGVLAIFKYYNFFNENIALLCQHLKITYLVPSLQLILPIGLSFHTFQALSYTIEVYRGNQKAERHLGIYALYVMFYPQLVAGPIERPQNLIHQFRENHKFDYDDFTNGLKLMIWGLFKKVVIADRLAVVVNHVYSNPTNYDGWPLLLATFFFSFQIYCDFSGYSDIAIGAAQCIGFKLMKNFNRPYLSKTIGEFWTRWHISLSTWFKDYLYIPLGGNRVPQWRWGMNVLTVFLLSGLWHGANWTFVIWGALHGAYLVIWSSIRPIIIRAEKLIGLDEFPAIHNAMAVLATFSLVTIAWIFFRANSVSNANYILTHLFSGRDATKILDLGLSKFDLIVGFGAIAVMETVHLVQQRTSIRQLLASYPTPLRWTAYYTAIGAIALFGKFNSQPFIYFQF